MSRFHVHTQFWQRWPRILVVERENDDGTRSERRYVPEKRLDEYRELLRDMFDMRCWQSADSWEEECAGCRFLEGPDCSILDRIVELRDGPDFFDEISKLMQRSG